MKRLIKKSVIRMMTLPPLFHLMNRMVNTAPIILTLHRQNRPEVGIFGHDNHTIKAYLAFLLRHNYRIVTLDVIDAWLRSDDDTDMTNTVAFTFDDGYKDQADMIRDVFLPMGVPASMFVITDFLDGKDWSWDAKINWLVFNAPSKKINLTVNTITLGINLDVDNNRRHKASKTLRDHIKYTAPQEMRRTIDELAAAVDLELPALPPTCHQSITWDEARELEARGIRFGSHSVNHYIFSTLDHSEAAHQLIESNKRINSELKHPLTVFCYPVGGRNDYTGRELLLALEAGYTSAVTMYPAVVQKSARTIDLERFVISRYACPGSIEDFEQYVSWIERIKDIVRNFSPVKYINSRFGTKRGLVRFIKVHINYLLGKYHAYEQVDWPKVKRLVFICQGNVCRSPFAEAVARANGLDAVSYGLATDGRTSVNPIASRVAMSFGIDMTQHVSKPFHINNLRPGDLLIGMEPDHYGALMAHDLPQGVQVSLMGLLNGRTKVPYLHDPYDLTYEYYKTCLCYIKQTVEQHLCMRAMAVG